MDFKNILNPPFQIGGLEITDLELKFVGFKNGAPFLISAKLEPGIIKEGEIKNTEAFLDALFKLRLEITGGRNKKVFAVISVPDNNVYVQAFYLPDVSGERLKEAAELNLQMISPIEYGDAYSDWRLVSGGEGDKLEALGVFAHKKFIDEIDKCLKKAGFTPAAIEFSGLSLVRLIENSGAGIDISKPYLLLHIGGNGLSFNLVKNGNLYFNHFVSWQSVYEDKREVPFESFKKLIIEEVKRVLNFYAAHWNGQLENVVLAAPGLVDDIVKVISENFAFKIQPLSLKDFTDISASWFTALGAAFRGLIPRSRDNFIGLRKDEIGKEFYFEKAIRFIKIWRNVVLITLSAITVIFGGADLFLRNTIDYLNVQAIGFMKRDEAKLAELEKFQNQSGEINKKIDLAVKFYDKRLKWSSFLEKIRDLAGADIIIERIFIQSPETPAVLSGLASAENSALDFKKRLDESGYFTDVDLPVDKIVQTGNGVNFTINFILKSF